MRRYLQLCCGHPACQRPKTPKCLPLHRPPVGRPGRSDLHARRRLRPNLLLDGVPDQTEPAWPGWDVAIGDALIGVHSRRARCIGTSIDPDTGEADLKVSGRIRCEFGNQLATNCWVVAAGTISAGDQAHLVPSADQSAHLGGWLAGAPYPQAGVCG